MKNTPLRRARASKGLSIHQVAAAVGTNAGNLSRIERAVQAASPALAERLASYFEPDITELEVLYPERFLDQA